MNIRLLAILSILSLGILYFPTPEKQETLANKPAEDYLMSMQGLDHLDEGREQFEFAALKANQKRRTRSQNTPWTQEGPYKIGGRINSVTIDPNNQNIVYVSTPDGGIWKSTNGGTTWTQQFQNQATLSVSAVSIDPNNSSILYAGTGDKVLGGYSHLGKGIFKSVNAGNSWVQVGLADVGMITKVVMHPTNSNIIYVGASGNPFIQDANRGVYKTTDAGVTWNKVLATPQNNVGIFDLEINNSNPNIVYATTRVRERSNSASLSHGTATKIYRSLDGGANWSILTNGLPGGDLAKIGIAISKTNPSLLYANVIDDNYDLEGIYRTTDGGNTWTQRYNGSFLNAGGFGWYFGEIEINPTNDNTIYWMGIDFYRSTSGGLTWSQNDDNDVHADKHSMAFLNGNSYLLATDGGIYKTTNNGNSWDNLTNMPITQFYETGHNPWQATEYYAGAQDNGTNIGSQAGAWIHYFGGDGFKPSFHPQNSSMEYLQTQNGSVWQYDGFQVNNVTQNIAASERCSWNSPYLLNKSNGDQMYFGSYRVHKNTNLNNPNSSWTAISGDLTDGTSNTFHVISTIDQSSINPILLYAGTSDGKLWVTENEGGSWSPINAGLPNRYMSSVIASPNNQNNVFLSQTGYRDNDSIPKIYFSSNKGTTWTNIASDLPNFSINDVWVDDDGTDNRIVIATQGGVYGTVNRGQSWHRIGNDMPIIPVFDIGYNPSTDRIVAGTFALSLQTMLKDSVFSIPGLMNVGTNDIVKGNEMSIYPNPARDFMSIQTSVKSPLNIYIFDLNGRQVKQFLKTQAKEKLDLSDLASNFYLLKIESEGKWWNQKLIR